MTGLACLGWGAAVVASVVAGALAWRLRARAELVARACHELRSPLTAARLALEALARSAPGSAGDARALGTIDLELRRAGLALDDLAAARTGRRVVDRPELIDAGELLEQVRAVWALTARSLGVELRVGPVPSDAVLRGDRGRLVQAVGNLVGNALEHGRGPVEVGVRETAAGGVRIEVRDAGPGLPAPLPVLARRARAGRGARGRGLAIASDIARRHRGQLVGAPASSGARVALELPGPGRSGAGRPWPDGRPPAGAWRMSR